MRLLALIPARGGSQRIPRKNIRELYGKPLIAWSIEAAQHARCVERVVVSTEDEEIAEIACAWGAEVPFMRPLELAQNDTPGIEPVLHALAELSEFDWVLLLQPTSPLRTSADVEGIVRYCTEQQAPAAVSICEVAKPPYWMYRCNELNRLVPFVDAPFVAGGQELPKVYVLNGALYLAQSNWLRHHKTFKTPETVGYPMPDERSADIDSPLDWEWGEFLMSRQVDQ